MVIQSAINTVAVAKLKIGFDAKRAFNNGSGLGNYARFIINTLAQFFPQHEYFLFTPTVKDEYKNFVEGSNVNIRLLTPESKFSKTFSSFWRTYSIAEMCNELNLDVFHGLSNELPVGIDTFKGKKLVTMHDLIFLRYPRFYNNIDRYIYTKKFSYACTNADNIIAASAQTKADVCQYFNTPESKITVGYQNCDKGFSVPLNIEVLNTIAKKYALPKNFMLCVGTIEKRKNQIEVLKAFHSLELTNMALVFIGKQTDYAQQLHQYVKDNHLQSQIVFLKQVPVDDLIAIYQCAASFVYMSSFEGFGIPILEALHTGLPILSANTSSLTEVGGSAIEYANPQDVNEIATKMAFIIGKKVNKNEYINQLNLFDPHSLITKLESLYHR